jgi:hypothetical protein
MSGMIPEDGYRPYPAWFLWFFAAACFVLAIAVVTH